MKIAFHAPLKSPDHPVPSGVRQMARMLIEALRLGGHDIGVASHLRTYSREPSEAAFCLHVTKDGGLSCWKPWLRAFPSFPTNAIGDRA
jgi:hypothetical protein